MRSLMRFLHAPSTVPLAMGQPLAKYSSYRIRSRFLITLHSAKGLEFDAVIMMGMDQGKIPSWAAKTPESKREPRRLFYVGLTRARHEVHITFSGFTVNRSGRRFDSGPSGFVIEVGRRLKEDRGSST